MKDKRYKDAEAATKKVRGYIGSLFDYKEDIRLLYVDLFCGAGGTSTGVNAAKVNGYKCAEVVACVNHDKNAIASHAANHPHALHFTEDMRTLELSPLLDRLETEKRRYPDAHVVLWASLECTNFSKAKGGMPRDADSRTLAEHLFRYIDAIQPSYIQIENVEEFMAWGALDEDGHPISSDRGKCYVKWVKNVESRGYTFDHRLLNAADFGAYTCRKRYFAIFAKAGMPIAWPRPTHDRYGRNGMKKWKAVREVLDFEDKGRSILHRDKPLAERTLQRIYAGLIKFVGGGKKAFLVKYNSMGQNGRYNAPGVDAPCPVVAAQNRLALAQVQFLSKQYSGDPYSKNIPADGPAGTVTTVDHHALVTVEHFFDMQYGNGRAVSVDRPACTITGNPKNNLVTVEHFLMNPQYDSAGSSVDKPCFTLIARMDKRPPYLVAAENGMTDIPVSADDTPMMRKIKEFMRMYDIVDIKMRMLKISELKKITGFNEDYKLVGTVTEQKKYIGNAVEVNMARVLCEALYMALPKNYKLAV